MPFLIAGGNIKEAPILEHSMAAPLPIQDDTPATKMVLPSNVKGL